MGIFGNLKIVKIKIKVMSSQNQQTTYHDINEYARTTSKTVLEYLVTLEKLLIGTPVDDVRIHSLKMYKGAMGSVRTTHCCPKGQQCTGWSTPHKNEIGWNGRVQIAYHKEPDTFGSEPFRYLSINSGTGGYNGDRNGLYKCNYDSTMFIKDLPLVYKSYLDYINEVKPLIDMMDSSDSKSNELGRGVLAAGHYDKAIEEIVNVLTGYNLKQQPVFMHTIYPYINDKMDREVWSENNNIPWNIEDKFFKYG